MPDDTPRTTPAAPPPHDDPSQHQPRGRGLGRRPGLKDLPINRMIPNMLTLLAVCAGLTGIRFAMEGKWEPAAVAILIAAVLDGLDGRVARILKGASKFGAELDSLSDFVCFGVAPAMILYLWSLNGAGKFGWTLVLLFAICMGLRLARFNTALEDANKPTWTKNYFSGVPAPAGAGLVLLPMILSFQVGDTFLRRPEVTSVVLLVVAGLLVSAIPTFSFKKVNVPQPLILPVMLFAGAAVAGLLSATWATLSAILIVYLATIPLSVRSYRRLYKRDQAAAKKA